MYTRLLNSPIDKSFFLFGPRGTGKSSWVKSQLPNALYVDLLDSNLYQRLLAEPRRLEERIPPGFKELIILDEVQKIPEILDEVHRLIEARGLKFVLTGSSARKLRKKGVNLLAGRALHRAMHPLTSQELGQDFRLDHSLRFGSLPAVYVEKDPQGYLESYVRSYLREEVQQEGLTRNIGAFSRFLEAASFSQGALLNVSKVAQDCSIDRKVVTDYFGILEDLLLATRVPVFTKRAKRRMVAHPKFYFFDVGVFRTLRPHGPLDTPEEIEGAALESLIFQELRALNDYQGLGYEIFYWRSSAGHEVDFVLYGERGILGIEVKRGGRVRDDDLLGLWQFMKDYPMAKGMVVYGGEEKLFRNGVSICPVGDFLKSLPEILATAK